MSPEIVTIIGLVVIFAIATVLPINMGALAFTAAFIIGTLSVGLTTDDILAGFPAELVLTLIGVTYLFAIAQNNGTVDLLVRGAVRLVGGHVAAIPWIMFFVTALLTAIGALSPAAVAIIAPIALTFAARHGINPLLMGMMVIHGAQGGGFSPISVYGVTVNDDRRGRGPAQTASIAGDAGQPLLQPGDRRWCCSSCSAAGSCSAGRWPWRRRPRPSTPRRGGPGARGGHRTGGRRPGRRPATAVGGGGSGGEQRHPRRARSR